MTDDQIETLLSVALCIAGAVGFGCWLGSTGAGFFAFAALSIAFRFSSK